MTQKSQAKSIDLVEVEKFSAIADEWWNESGKFKPLHKINPVRISYILESIKNSGKEIQNLSILDIGCGGGLLCEPLARLGAKVTGVDASEKNINIASIHAEKQGLEINYIATSVEELAKKKKRYDLILNMEVIEHVADVDSFLESSAKLLKKDGLMFIATLNRTVKSYAFAIIGAEYILRWLPKNTHDWNKFLKPSEIEKKLRNCEISLKELKGMSYNPVKDSWKLSDDIDVNYIMLAKKEE